jgi:DNA-binding response OmpR family regulator
MKILLVEDDRRIVTALQEALTDQGYVLEIAEDGKTGLAFAEGASFDLIILDWMLPHLDGISLCKKLRQRGDRTPILILTARDTSSDKVVGLDVGADDYVVKPFDLPELLARVRALLRRGVVTFSPVLEWERLTFDPGECRAEYNQQPISLTPKEYGLLELLLRNGSRVLDLQEMARSAADLWELIHHEYAELGEEDDRPPVPLNPDGTAPADHPVGSAGRCGRLLGGLVWCSRTFPGNHPHGD